MTPAAARRASLLVALALGGAAGFAAWRSGRPAPRAAAPALAGSFSPEDAERARRLLGSLLSGLASLQEPDGGFLLWDVSDRPSSPEPEIRRTASSALAAWALVAAAARPEAAERPWTLSARDRVLAYLLGRQKEVQGGGFGAMPPNPLGAVDAGPEVTALAAGALSLAGTRDPAHAVGAGQAARRLAQVATGPVRDGWMRALLAMAIDGLLASGRQADLGARGRTLLPLGNAPVEPDCGDYRLAEAIVRTLRGAPATGDLFPEQVLSVCLTAEPPAWNGQGSDLASWLMQAWLAARSRQARPWFAAVLPALEEAVRPDGLVPQSVYADRVAQTACAVLVLLEGLGSTPAEAVAPVPGTPTAPPR